MLAEKMERPGSFSGLNTNGSCGRLPANGIIEALIELPQVKTDQIEGELMLINLIYREEYRVWDQ